MQCFRAGAPFGTRLVNHGGLVFPPTIKWWPHLICEACTVRAVVGRELTGSREDQGLLMLERVRVLDMAFNWSKNTHKAYQSKIRVLQKFENDFNVSVLQSSALTCPPHGPAIPTMWAQQRYAVAPRQRTPTNTSAGKSLQWNTVRGLRSAASQFFAIDTMVANPQTMMDPSDRLIVAPSDCLPTDEAGFLWMSKGMKNRMGDDVKPSKALLERHVRWIDDLLETQWSTATNMVAKAAACRAATANLVGWLSWLRGGETFSLRWEDTTVVQPSDGPTLGLPPGVGMVGLALLEQTKSSQGRQADVVMAYTTGSGFSLGKWLDRLRALLNPDDQDYVLCHPDGRPWTSHYYRHQYLYPWLEAQRGLGDPYLQQYDGSLDDNTIKNAFWSFHCYRRGAKTHVSRKRPTNQRNATGDEVYEHGRWRQKRSSMDMNRAYTDWSFEDRVMITLLCM